jgi:hypothetical protein
VQVLGDGPHSGLTTVGPGDPDCQVRVLSHRVSKFATPGAAYCPHWHRIGDLTDDDQDLWWRFNATEPAARAAAAQDMH